MFKKPEDKPTTKKGDKAEEKTFSHDKITDKEVEIAAETLVGDLRDALLGHIKTLQKPWQQMSETQQRDLVASMTNAAKHLTSRAVKLIAANGRKTIVAHLHEMKIDKGVLTCKVTTSSTDETTLELKAAQNKTVLIIAGDSAEFEGEKKPAEIDPDQPDLEKNILAKTSGAKVAKAKPGEAGFED